MAIALTAASVCVSIAAPNDGCVGGDCVDVPVDGIKYTSGVTEVNVGNGVAGTTYVTTGNNGIALSRYGTPGPDEGTEADFVVLQNYDIDPGETETLRNVVTADGTNPLLVDGKYIFSDNATDPTFTIGADHYTGKALAEYLTTKVDNTAGSIAGSLTVNNKGPLPADAGAPFRTTNAAGIHVQSSGGRGGTGSCSSIGVYSWCDNGGTGGAAGSVAVNSNAAITVSGPAENKYGVVAISQGGAGGNGGGAFGLFASDAGKGGNGGIGNDVYVTLGPDSSIRTYGTKGHGVFAQSRGGDGGKGGDPSSLVALGSKGGNGGNAGKVFVDNDGSILTTGKNAHAIYARSVGAGAGDGSTAGGLFAFGGNGGGQTNGSTVTVNNSGSIETRRDDSSGVFAQSIGGGGGDGGGAGGLFAVGGAGGSGGDSDIVKIIDSGRVKTGGDRSTAIIAQSIGGGGGNGGDAIAVGPSISVAIGGAGGLGGKGANVEVTADGSDIDTGGEDAHGIHAQSIGGGGGNGGMAVSGSIPTNSPVNVSVALGGNGGAGGNAGERVDVKTTSSTDIATKGVGSYGIAAQSIGGGGGNGGSSYAATGGGSLNVTVAVGGKGGVAGDGKTVIVNNAATITTKKDLATGILAQSVGGGGGNGGFSGTVAAGGASVGVSLGGGTGGGGKSGLVRVTNTNTIRTDGESAVGIFAQSLGGGGGNGGGAFSGTGGVVGVSVAVGGKGGAGSDGGQVTVNNYGSITTGHTTESVVDGETVVEHFGSLSHGIYAQSVGGGGGNGGMALAGAIGVALPNVPGGAAAISVGGKGGGASDGKRVTVNNRGSIETFGLGSHAIYAQSVGGGGGNGGLAGSVAMTVGNGAAVGVAVGGSGSGGGNAGVVDVNDLNTAATIITHADGADGIHAQSVGGGGGDGGFAMAGAFGFGGEKSVNVAVAIGGEGGAGGTGNTVDVTSHSAITTYGNNANGVMAQSVGGGGGNGGMAVTGTLAFAETAGAVGVSVGGAGGKGNFGGLVKVDNFGSITTWGNDAMGILAHSIGGSGGNGGLAVAAQMTGSSKNAATVGVAIGGKGGGCEETDPPEECNNGGKVDVTNRSLGTILTNGLGAHGIKAQSVGGGGGNGGLAIAAQLGKSGGSEAQASKTLNVGVSVGGDGGKGGYGNTVHVINNGSITAKGAAATGIFAQSVGGGGGDGGGAVSAVGMLTDSANASSRSVVVTAAIGGKGGVANVGGDVTVDNTGSVVTEGVSGHGIFAQSIGGGGGVGGRANTLQLVVTKPVSTGDENNPAKITNQNNVQLGASIGGVGGTGGHGGKVIVNNEGTIETWNETSYGIYAQSIGAGGGDGGNGTLGPEGLLPIPGGQTVLEKSLGLFGFKESVKAYKNIQVAVGGSAGATGNGGEVEVNNNKDITTHGSNSHAIFVENIGGGGGVGGTAVIGKSGKLGVGGESGAAGDGGDVTVNQYGGAKIETFGVASSGIFAHSVGGGGGVAGNVDRLLANQVDLGLFKTPALNLGVGLALGRSGGAGGNGGIIDVDVDGQIITHGDSAAGIFAQSVGGGGGVLGELGNDLPGLSLLSWQIGSAGAAGNAGLVDVNLNGSIVTAGNNATGIFAQSTGGTGTAGAVNVMLNGSILTGEVLQSGDENRGLGSIGILAQSAAVNNANNGDINIDINSTDGIVRGGHSQAVNIESEYFGVGVWVMDGMNNTITNRGTITTHGGVDEGFAILATGSDATHIGGNETVFNYGTVTGNVSLGAGTNTFNNNKNATFNSGETIALGTGNPLNNVGTLSPGGEGNVFTTTLTGNLVQTGIIAVDMDSNSGKADRIDVSGAANLAGVAKLNILNPGQAFPGTRQAAIVTGAGGATDSGLTPVYKASAVVNFELVYANATDVLLETTIDFAPAEGLNHNQSVIGEAVNNIQRAGGSQLFAPIAIELINLPDAKSIGEAYQSMGPESLDIIATASHEAAQLYTQTLIKRLHSIRSWLDTTGIAPGTRQTRPYGLWIEGFGESGDLEAASGFTGFDYTLGGAAIGLDRLVKDGLLLGVSYGESFTDIDLDSANGKGDIESRMFSFYGSSFSDKYYLDAAFSWGRESYDNTRRVVVGALSDIARSSHDGDLFSFYTEAGYNVQMNKWLTQPFAALQYFSLDEDSYVESGASGINLMLKGRKTEALLTDLGLRFSRPFNKNNMVYIPEISLAWRHDYDIDERRMTAAFDGSPEVFFTTESRNADQDGILLGLGITLISKSAMSLNLRYDSEMRGDFTSQQISGGLRYEF